MVQRSSVVALLYLLDVVAWVIILGGQAAWQYQCNTDSTVAADGLLCGSSAIQLSWWATW